MAKAMPLVTVSSGPNNKGDVPLSLQDRCDSQREDDKRGPDAVHLP